MDRISDIFTPRLHIRPFIERDFDDMFELLSDAETCRDDGGYEPISEKNAAFYEMAEEMTRDAGRYSVTLRETGKMIGQVHVMDALGRCVKGYEIGYVINKDYRRRGYAAEAVSRVIDACFSELGAEIVTGGAFDYNLVSRAMFEKLGFTYEGITHKAARHCAYGVVDMANYYLDPPGWAVKRLDERDYHEARLLDSEAFRHNGRGGDPAQHYGLADSVRNSPFFVPELDIAAYGYDVALLGHAIFSRLPLGGDSRAVWLSSLAVRHSNGDDIENRVFAHQRRGIGTALVRRGLQIARELGFGACFACEDFDYFIRRLGFADIRAMGFERDATFDDSEGCVFVRELTPGGLNGAERRLSLGYYDFTANARRRLIEVLPYSDDWARGYERIRDMLSTALNGAYTSIEHVGSTSVPGLYAKPIIDIDIVYPVGGFDALRARLSDIGFVRRGDMGIAGREAFEYTGDAALPAHHLYACQEGSRELIRHTALRDFLRAHDDRRDGYSRVKLAAAKKFPYDIDAYINEKTACVMGIYKSAGVEGE